MNNARSSRPWIVPVLGLTLVTLSGACDVSSEVPAPAPDLGTSSSELAGDAPVGLSLFFRDGAIAPIALAGSARRYLQEIDIVNTVTSSTDEGPTPLVTSGVMGHVDWSGLTFVEDDWREPGDGTWTHQRFYRGARWMEELSVFALTPRDARGHVVGLPIVFDAGRDDHFNERFDDGFVRRFDVRQIIKGCRAQFDCSNATSFAVQGLVQARQERHPDLQARLVPQAATSLELSWSADASTRRTVGVSHTPANATPYGYGFAPTLTLASAPANGHFYAPGETLSIRVGFFDGHGHPLNAPGSLPTYADTLSGNAGGVRYWDPTLDTVLFYALKHREGNMILQVSGPSNALAVPKAVTEIGAFFGPQVVSASVPVDGFSGFAVEIPPLPSVLGGFADPTQWQLPNSDVQTLTIPADALPGTYTAVIKARREWAGEALNRGATVSFQVGSATATSFAPQTGHCDSCHAGRSDLGVVNHGIADRRTCFGCHQALSFELDSLLDYRIHSIHTRSRRFPGNFGECETCHVSPPTGPARGAFGF